MWKGLALNPPVLLSFLLLCACSFPRPADIPPGSGDDDSPGPGDASTDIPDAPVSMVAIQVSPVGDDANDGFTKPVRTLKHALSIAAENKAVELVTMAEGNYTFESGETFPYIVPHQLTIAGPVTGRAVLIGADSGDGLVLDAGQLQDIELDNFAVAVAAAGQSGLKQVKIKNSKQALLGQAGSKLSVDHVEVVGSVDACGAGIRLEKAANLVASDFNTSNLSSSIKATGTNAVTVSKSSFVGDPRCDCMAIELKPEQEFELISSIVVGCRVSLRITGGGSAPTRITLTDTTLRNAENAISSESVVLFTMNGGVLSNTTNSAAGFFGGLATFSNVSIHDAGGSGVAVLGGPTVGTAILVMRGCTVTNNVTGVLLFDSSEGNLGLSSDPGNNIFQLNQKVGVSVIGMFGPKLVNAIGNIWNPDRQGANSDGVYPTTDTIPGPVVPAAFDNFEIASGLSLRR